MIITIGGSIGSGKTTLAEKLAERHRLRRVSAGFVMREMAEESGMSLLEYSKYAEKDPRIDKAIDRRQKKIALEYAAEGGCVVDGRLSAYFLPADLRIWLDASLKVRAERVALREGISLRKAKEEILERESSEIRRYKKIYGIDLRDLSIYDLVIRNNRFTVEDTVEIVSAALKKYLT